MASQTIRCCDDATNEPLMQAPAQAVACLSGYMNYQVTTDQSPIKITLRANLANVVNRIWHL